MFTANAGASTKPDELTPTHESTVFPEPGGVSVHEYSYSS